MDELRVAFDVACPADHAFSAWTSRINAWWPADHTVTGRDDATVVMEPGVGGRIYERTADGSEHEWGTVTVWEPPRRVAYTWRLGAGAGEPTEVEITFREASAASTRVEIDHRGWERLGDDARSRYARNQQGWETLVPRFIAAITEGAA